jgi:NADH:ubiquinone oxidoreductase subunit
MRQWRARRFRGQQALTHKAGDTKYGQLVGTDKYGNKYYENTEELPCTNTRDPPSLLPVC